jgi:putative transposase
LWAIGVEALLEAKNKGQIDCYISLAIFFPNCHYLPIMRSARLKLPDHYPVTYFHCISRVVNRDFRFGDHEKSVFTDWMRRYEIFCGVRVVTFCIMSNHFHILVEVTKRPADKDLPTDAELICKVRQCQGNKTADLLKERLADTLNRAKAAVGPGEDLATLDLEATTEAASLMRYYHSLREQWFSRMWDVSRFMQGLKRRFSAWYNKEHHRVGTLWEERFKSVIVQGGSALATVAAYIDLNPVRAKIVEDPADYRWSGYGEACHGVQVSRRALRNLIQLIQVPRIESQRDAMRWYRCYIYQEGLERGLGPNGKPMKAGFTQEQVERVKAQQGALPAVAQLQRRVRYFSDGMVMGTKAFVNEVFGQRRELFGSKRKSGARRLKGADWGELRAMRDLRESSV